MLLLNGLEGAHFIITKEIYYKRGHSLSIFLGAHSRWSWSVVSACLLVPTVQCSELSSALDVGRVSSLCVLLELVLLTWLPFNR